MRMLHNIFAIVAVACMTGAATSSASAAGAGMTMGRYLGPPDLGLTSAVIAVGGGPADFHSTRLIKMLAAQHTPAELQTLNKRFGAARTQQFFITFDAFVNRAIATVQKKHVVLPKPARALVRDPARLTASLYRSGTMSDGRFDIGYLLEHLLSRDVHKQLMDDVNRDYAIGPGANAEFHIIFASAMHDLASLYNVSS